MKHMQGLVVVFIALCSFANAIAIAIEINAENAKHHPENAKTHPENTKPHPENAKPNPENAKAHPEIAKLHAEIAKLKAENAKPHPENTNGEAMGEVFGGACMPSKFATQA